MSLLPESASFSFDGMRQVLGLQYSLSFAQGAVAQPEVSTRDVDRNHILVLPNLGMRNEYEVRVETAELLVRAKLYEMVHPMFGQYLFWAGSTWDMAEAESAAVMVSRAQQVKKVWVSDLMAEWFSKGMLAERVGVWLKQASWMEDYEVVTKKEEHLIHIAWAGAALQRHDMGESLLALQNEAMRAMSLWTEEDGKRLADLTNFFGGLGTLLERKDEKSLMKRVTPEESREALEKFEAAAQVTARVLGYGVKPVMVAGQGRMYWTPGE
jgi:hypothetical protein